MPSANSFEEAKRIVETCDTEITESIDNLSILNKSRDNISRRILTRLNDLCISALLLNAMKDGYQSPNAGFAWEYSLLRANTKYLGNFYRGLQYIGRRIPEEGQAERLMLKYYSFMWEIRQSLYENYGITVLQNLEKFQEYTGTDELDKQYYELVANAFSNPKTEQKHNSNTRFYMEAFHRRRILCMVEIFSKIDCGILFSGYVELDTYFKNVWDYAHQRIAAEQLREVQEYLRSQIPWKSLSSQRMDLGAELLNFWCGEDELDWGYSQYFEIAAGNLKPFLAMTLFTEILCKHFPDVMSAPVKRLSSKL